MRYLSNLYKNLVLLLLIIYGRIHHYKSFAPKLPHVKKIKRHKKPLDYWCPMIYNTITR